MDQLVSWLEDIPVDRMKLFSDSSQDVKVANWKKIVEKESKTYIYIKITHIIFSTDNNITHRSMITMLNILILISLCEPWTTIYKCMYDH
jgi:hypothetical protein